MRIPYWARATPVVDLPAPTVDDLLERAVLAESRGFYPEAYTALHHALALDA